MELLRSRVVVDAEIVGPPNRERVRIPLVDRRLSREEEQHVAGVQLRADGVQKGRRGGGALNGRDELVEIGAIVGRLVRFELKFSGGLGREVPSAVLIRALQLEFVPSWIEQRLPSTRHRIAAGPGKLCNALKIDRTLNAQLLQPGQSLWLEHRHPQFQPNLIQTTRIGLSQGTDLPWRWYLQDSLAVSKA